MIAKTRIKQQPHAPENQHRTEDKPQFPYNVPALMHVLEVL